MDSPHLDLENPEAGLRDRVLAIEEWVEGNRLKVWAVVDDLDLRSVSDRLPFVQTTRSEGLTLVDTVQLSNLLGGYPNILSGPCGCQAKVLATVRVLACLPVEKAWSVNKKLLRSKSVEIEGVDRSRMTFQCSKCKRAWW